MAAPEVNRHRPSRIAGNTFGILTGTTYQVATEFFGGIGLHNAYNNFLNPDYNVFSFPNNDVFSMDTLNYAIPGIIAYHAGMTALVGTVGAYMYPEKSKVHKDKKNTYPLGERIALTAGIFNFPVFAVTGAIVADGTTSFLQYIGEKLPSRKR